ncbi:MAG TPA: hypothetical protein VM890_12945, partial [Longimicrobium sp.]|nr:hypothetical protein [Longimicrobium sp.]
QHCTDRIIPLRPSPRDHIMERTRFIEHKGHRILLLDYSRIQQGQEAVAAIKGSMEVVATQPRGSLLVMTVVREARYNSAVLQALKELAAHNAPYVKASAVVGMGGLHRIAYQAVILFSRRKIQTFDTEAQALDWLVQQA